jgi:multicomponent Na+:H+ antiporter subunit D
VSPLPPIPVVVPVLVAAIIAMGASKLPRRVIEAIEFLAALASLAVCAILLVRSTDHRIVYWFSGWRPHHEVALGISFTIDSIGAGAGVLISSLFVLAFVFSWRYFEETVQGRYGILMLVFLGSMNAFAFTGDLFDLFVFFELMSVVAYALTAYRIEEQGPLQGALNFAIVNSLGTFSILLGIAMIYARTGALNMAQIGHSLAGRAPDGLIVVGFTLVMVGLFVKASVVPFHFWLADAHAVAPPTVCVLFSGVMVELALYAAARVYWAVFQGALAQHQVAIGHVLIGFGVATAIVGSMMCFFQQHLKRMLAYSTIGHVGLFLMAFGLMEHVGFAGAVIYVVAHGAVKAALFLLAGILVYRLAQIDEEHLRGKGSRLVGTGIMFAVGGIGLAEVPPFGTFVGKTLIEDAGSAAGYHWMPWVFGFVAAMTGGTVLRAAGRIFLGWGPEEHDRFGSEKAGEEEGAAEIRNPRDRTPLTLWLPAAILLAVGFGLGLVPNLSGHVEQASAQFQGTASYQRAVLGTEEVPLRRVEAEPPSSLGIWYGLASGAAAVSIALLALFRRRLGTSRIRSTLASWLWPPVKRLRLLHSGHVGDYAAWFAVGLAVLGGLFTMATR